MQLYRTRIAVVIQGTSILSYLRTSRHPSIHSKHPILHSPLSFDLSLTSSAIPAQNHTSIFISTHPSPPLIPNAPLIQFPFRLPLPLQIPQNIFNPPRTLLHISLIQQPQNIPRHPISRLSPMLPRQSSQLPRFRNPLIGYFFNPVLVDSPLFNDLADDFSQSQAAWVLASGRFMSPCC